MNKITSGITRKEAFKKVLDILDECNAIEYSSRGKFKKSNLLDSLINTSKDNRLWKEMGYSDSGTLTNHFRNKLNPLIWDRKQKFISSGRWDIFLLYIIGYRYCNKCNKCYALNVFSKDINNKPYEKKQTCKKCDLYNKRETVLHIIKIMIQEGKLPECSICGYKENWAALDFHHINPKLERPEWAINKNPSNYIFSYSIKIAEERYLKEMNNLQLVCSNCHKDIHNNNYRERNKGLIDSLYELKYNYICDVITCNEEKHLHLHHNDPREKEYSFVSFHDISKNRILDERLLEKEMNKDIKILCGNHHMEIHHPEWKMPLINRPAG